MLPTIVGMSVVIVGLTAWCVYLTVALFTVRDTAADALDHILSGWERLSGRVASLESPAYPKYLGTLTGSQIDAQDESCNGADTEELDPVWGEHDQRVREALTQAQKPIHKVITADPESSPFFTESER